MKKYALMIIIAVLLLAVIVTGLWFAGSPRQARLERFDAQRQSDIATLQNYLHSYWTERGTLPATLAQVTSTAPYVIIPVDPRTFQPYEYIRISSSTFSLCAVFETEKSRLQDDPPRYFSGFAISDQFMRHGIGRTCFERTLTDRLSKD